MKRGYRSPGVARTVAILAVFGGAGPRPHGSGAGAGGFD